MNLTEERIARIGQLDAAQRRKLQALLNDPIRKGRGVFERKPVTSAPLAFPQRRLWLMAQLGSDEGAYNIPGVFVLKGKLDVSALHHAVRRMAECNEILRTTFGTNAEGVPVQHIGIEAVLDWRVTDLGADANEVAIARFAQNLIAEPLDIAQGPCWRIALARLDDHTHVLAMSFHHIVFDGWSLGVYVRGLFEHYRAQSQNVQAPGVRTDVQSLQYTDYVRWQLATFDDSARTRETAYWTQQLAGPLPLLELPTDRPYPQQRSFKGALHKRLLPQRLFDRIKQLARTHNATPYAVFLGAYAALIYRLSGQTEVVIGTPVSGRSEQDLEALLGVFVNTLPLRVRLNPGQGLGALIEHVRDVSLDAFAHATLPFDEMVEALHPERVPGRNPIFQTLYTYQNAIAPVQIEDLSATYLDVDQGSAKFDLSLDVVEGPQGPSCLWEYSLDVFDAQQVERMAAQLERLLGAAVDQPQQPLSHLPLLGDDELALIMRGLRTPEHALPANDFVTLFEQRVREQPDNIALRAQGVSVTYAELNGIANRQARDLLARGAQPGQAIGLGLERGAPLIAAVLATLKLGAFFVALDPGHPARHSAFVAADAGVQWVLTERRHAAAFESLSASLLCVDEDVSARAALPGHDLGIPVDAQACAYVVYTSGTTGLPKGVGISHRNMVNAYLGWNTVYGLESDHEPSLTRPVRVHLQMAAFGFDVFCGDLIRALGSGGSLVICPQAMLAEPERLADLIDAERVQCAEFVPAVFRGLAEYLIREQRRLDGMKLVVVASDHWYVSEYRRFKALLASDARLINSYGMAEASIDSTWFEGDADTLAHLPDGALVPVGQPFPNVHVLVLDAHLQPVPVGVPGEICVGGLGVGQGYLNRAELSAQKFVPHPFITSPAVSSARLYRTGDLGCLRADGRLDLLGRRDTQVKINGMRLELGEVEMALESAPGVRQAAAVVRVDEPDHVPRLVGYLVPQADTVLDLAAIELDVASSLPGYMVPRDYVVLAALPLSHNGKVDRLRLPALARDPAQRMRAFVSPRTLSEEVLANLFAQAFNLPRVGIHDNFFELGGHSLLALQIVSRAREAFAVDLPLRALFDNPTVVGLAQAISELQGTREAYDDTVNAVKPIEPDPARIGEAFPLTEVQQAYWLGRNEVFEFGNVTTHSYDEMETAFLDKARFQRAWNKVVARHPMLRALVLDDGTQQILTEVPPYEIREVDLRGRTPEGQAQGILDVRNEMSHQRLNVKQWPVFDVRITRLADDAARIHFSSDALMFDVWSFVIIIEDLVRAYLDESLVLEPLQLSFRDYVLAEAQLHHTPRYNRALAYWRARVSNLPPAPELPMAKDPSAIVSPKFTRLHATLDPVRWERLKRKTLRSGITTTGLMLAVYAEVLAAYSRDPAFSLNLTFLNRHPLHHQVNEIVGEFTSLTLLSVDMARDENFTARARRVQSDLWNDLEHHAISGVEVLRQMTRATGGATRAKMPVVFTSALVVPIPKRNAALPITPVYRDGVTQTSQVWLDCGVWEDNQMLLCNWDVVLELYPAGLIEEMFDIYWQLVTRLADDDTAWHAPARSLVPARERAAGAELALPALPVSELTLADLFDQSWQQTPDAPALFDGDIALSYADLAQYAAAVRAAVSRADGQQGELVAVAMHKGWEQVAAVLGVVHTHCAYLPIDPALPDERVSELLSDARVRIVVTTPDLRARMTGFGIAHIVVVDAQARADAALLCQTPRAAADDLAYTLFTSGSTGRPKGVMIDHRGAVNTLRDLISRWSLGAEMRVLAVSSLSFDLSVFDIFGTLGAGGTIVMPAHERRLDTTHWLDLVQRHGITLWNSVPALCGLLMDHAEQSGAQLPSLQRVMLSGDWIPLALHDRIRAKCPAARITSLGGATEASIWSVLYEMTAVDPAWRSVPYGTAMRNQRVEVLNSHLDVNPDWVVGEIHIGGTGLALGYWGDEAKTQAAFVFHQRTGERWYRTGDLGRRLPDGNIEFLGRNDTQVKVQGYRIELGEIEAVMRQHPAVADAVAVAVGERHGEKRLAGFFVVRPDPVAAVLEAAALRRWLQARLPEYMVPLSLQALDRIPLTANGKVDRKALPVTLSAQVSEAVPRVSPRDALETRIAQLWCDVLGVPSVGVWDDFFVIGGDSMQAIKLLATLRHQLDVDFQLRDIFAKPTVAAQAERARSDNGTPGVFATPLMLANPLPPRQSENAMPRRTSP